MNSSWAQRFPDAANPQWPQRIIELGAGWSRCSDAGERGRIASQLWPLINAALLKYLRIHADRFGVCCDEDLRDIASEKSIELLRKLDDGAWQPTDWSAAQLCSFVSKLARNGLIDHVRLVVSKQQNGVDGWLESAEAAAGHRALSADQHGDVAVERLEYAEALRECLGRLRPRAQVVWFLRVLLEMPSRMIARHPEVSMKPATVDVTLARCRARMLSCMQGKGFGPFDMPPGTFATLWAALRLPGADDQGPRGVR